MKLAERFQSFIGSAVASSARIAGALLICVLVAPILHPSLKRGFASSHTPSLKTPEPQTPTEIKKTIVIVRRREIRRRTDGPKGEIP